MGRSRPTAAPGDNCTQTELCFGHNYHLAKKDCVVDCAIAPNYAFFRMRVSTPDGSASALVACQNSFSSSTVLDGAVRILSAHHCFALPLCLVD